MLFKGANLHFLSKIYTMNRG